MLKGLLPKGHIVERVRAIRGLVFVVVALVALSTTGAAFAVGNRMLVQGQTDQRAAEDARHQAGWDSFVQQRQAWAAHLDLGHLDYSQLVHKTVEGSILGHQQYSTLSQAAIGADMVTDGVVVSVKPSSGYMGQIVTLQVIRTLKGSGSAGSTVTIYQDSGLEPGVDFQGVHVSDIPFDPALLPGDHVVLLMISIGSNEFRPELYSGQYRVGQDGTVTANRLNEFAGTVNGLPETAFLSKLSI